MVTQISIKVEPLRAVSDDLSALIAKQDHRFFALDNHLAGPRNPAQIAQMLRDGVASGQPVLVARTGGGRVVGCAVTALWQFSEEQEMSAFYAPRTGLVRQLFLPPSLAPEAQAAFSALLAALDRQWQGQQTEGELITWLSSDHWVESQLKVAGFAPDNILAVRGLEPLPASQRPAPAGVTTRLAQQQDAEELVGLHLGELEFHLPYSPFARMVPALEREFRQRLLYLWANEDVDRLPVIVVAERAGEVVAMAECYVETLPGWLSNYRLPDGNYGYLNSVGVRPDLRGLGIGRLLVQGVFEQLAAYEPLGYALWFTYSNPLSSKFWPHLGFRPLWTQYQRRRGIVGTPLWHAEG